MIPKDVSFVPCDWHDENHGLACAFRRRIMSLFNVSDHEPEPHLGFGPRVPNLICADKLFRAKNFGRKSDSLGSPGL